MARRFAIVCPNYHPRTCGIGDHSMRLGQELQRRGLQCTVFTRTPASPNPIAPEVPVVAIDGPTPVVIADRLRRRIAAYEPTDVLLQYTPQMFDAWRFGTPATAWLAAAARLSQRNVIVLAHELFLSWHPRPDLFLGAAMMRVQLAAMLKVANWLFVTVGARANEIRRLEEAVRPKHPVGVVRVGPNAIPLPRTAESGALRLGTFSTLGRDKRFDVVLDCFERVRRQYPEAELVLLGDLEGRGDRRAESFLASISRHPARDRIRLPGRQSLDEISREVAALDVYLFPMMTGANTRSGTLPVALGTGLPVVAIRGSETDDLFLDGENILFADNLSGEAFAATVLRVAGDPGLRDRVSQGARAVYRRYLSWESVTDQLLEPLGLA